MARNIKWLTGIFLALTWKQKVFQRGLKGFREQTGKLPCISFAFFFGIIDNGRCRERPLKVQILSVDYFPLL